MTFDLKTAQSAVVEKLTSWWTMAAEMLPNAVVAVVVLLAFALAGRLVSKAVMRLSRRAGYPEALVNLVTTLVRVAIVALGAFIALEALNLEKTVTSLLAGAGIIGLALGFAFQDIAENLIAGLMLGMRRPLEVGDLIETNGVLGYVRNINLRNTVVENFAGQRLFIPNKKVFNEVLSNYTKHGYRRVDIPVGVTYAADLDQVVQVIREALEGVQGRYEDKGVQVFCDGFGASSIDFSARFWIPMPGDLGYLDARHEGFMRVRKALADHDITIPFPIRTLDFGIEGGEQLRAHLARAEEQTEG